MYVPILQLDPIQPARQLHVPSVCLHVLQLDEQTCVQFPPKYPFLQAKKNKAYCL